MLFPRTLVLAGAWCWVVLAQPPFPPTGAGPGRPGFPGMGPPGSPGGETIALVAKFDRDGNRRLDQSERAAARKFLEEQPSQRGPMGPGRPYGMERAAAKPGKSLTPDSVRSYSGEPFYDPRVLRTLFLKFETAGWESELAAFKNTDVEVPAALVVDGRSYADVGVRFRGSSSYMMVPDGYKRSLNLSLDFVHKGQNLLGYRSLNLLNSNQDPTFLRAPVYLGIVRRFIPAPQANHVRVVINGESWGVYINLEQVNNDFLERAYSVSAKEAKASRRWKVLGIPFGGGGLDYLGDDPDRYRRLYEIKSKDEPDAWKALIHLCKTLKETPLDRLESALAPLLDTDGALKFLALENALINNDGYWTRASDFHLYQDTKGRFRIIPHDVNETLSVPEQMPGGFRRPVSGSGAEPGAGPPPMPPGSGRDMGQGPGGDRRPGFAGFPPGDAMPRPPRRTEPDLDPFAGADDPRKPLLHRLLAVPALRARYIAILRDIATRHLDWTRMEPDAREAQALIAADVAADTRKLASTAAFYDGLAAESTSAGAEPGPAPLHSTISLKSFFEKRRAYLLAHPALRPDAEARP